MSLEHLPPHITDEIEVVRAVFGEDAVRICDGGAASSTLKVEVDLRPRVEAGTALVSVTLALVLPPGYPNAAAPQTSIERSRGLGDGAISKLLIAARSSSEAHGLAEDGCLCQLLTDLSEVLDVANDESECNICLAPCEGGAALHAPCDHVYHVACLARWATIKTAEAEAAVGDATQSARAQRDALVREVAEAAGRVADTVDRLAVVERRVLWYTARRDHARRILSGEDDYEPFPPCPYGESDDGEEEEEGQDAMLEKFEAKLAAAKADVKQVRAEERRARNRSADLEQKLGSLEAELAAEAARAAAASLPCPVCRSPIDKALLKSSDASTGDTGLAVGTALASVEALPQKLRDQARKLQREHAVILARRQSREQEAFAAFEAAAAEGPAIAAEQTSGPREVHSGDEQRLLQIKEAARTRDAAATKVQRKGGGKGAKGASNGMAGDSAQAPDSSIGVSNNGWGEWGGGGHGNAWSSWWSAAANWNDSAWEGSTWGDSSNAHRSDSGAGRGRWRRNRQSQ
eukprot:CAMPEP_0117552792 /NCGR_PEP_ID=MMETSP0784-20121206/49890_1 /TAXON_ID=39447 /ORGANISM="" /LENGTH=518 /DNA_ID=CAMNT_0005349875 /DNA_START=47 /DNA_END=1600 /DNA_ORIENTATION=+